MRFDIYHFFAERDNSKKKKKMSSPSHFVIESAVLSAGAASTAADISKRALPQQQPILHASSTSRSASVEATVAAPLTPRGASLSLLSQQHLQHHHQQQQTNRSPHRAPAVSAFSSRKGGASPSLCSFSPLFLFLRLLSIISSFVRCMVKAPRALLRCCCPRSPQSGPSSMSRRGGIRRYLPSSFQFLSSSPSATNVHPSSRPPSRFLSSLPRGASALPPTTVRTLRLCLAGLIALGVVAFGEYVAREMRDDPTYATIGGPAGVTVGLLELAGLVPPPEVDGDAAASFLFPKSIAPLHPYLASLVDLYTDAIGTAYCHGLTAEGHVYACDASDTAGGGEGDSNDNGARAAGHANQRHSLSAAAVRFVPDEDFPSLPLPLPAWPRPFGLTPANAARSPAGRLMHRMLGRENDGGDIDSLDGIGSSRGSNSGGGGSSVDGADKKKGLPASEWFFSEAHTNEWHSRWRGRYAAAVRAVRHRPKPSSSEKNVAADVDAAAADAIKLFHPFASVSSSAHVAFANSPFFTTSVVTHASLAALRGTGLLDGGGMGRGIAALADAFAAFDGRDVDGGGGASSPVNVSSSFSNTWRTGVRRVAKGRAVPVYATICGAKDCPILANHFASFINPSTGDPFTATSLGRFILVLNTHEPKWVAFARFLEALFPQRFVVEYAMLLTRALSDGQAEYRRRHGGSDGTREAASSSGSSSSFSPSLDGNASDSRGVDAEFNGAYSTPRGPLRAIRGEASSGGGGGLYNEMLLYPDSLHLNSSGHFRPFSPPDNRRRFADADAVDDALDRGDSGAAASTRLYRWHLRHFHPHWLRGVGGGLAPLHSVSMGWNRIAHLAFRGEHPAPYATIANGDFYLIGAELGDYSENIVDSIRTGHTNTVPKEFQHNAALLAAAQQAKKRKKKKGAKKRNKNSGEKALSPQPLPSEATANADPITVAVGCFPAVLGGYQDGLLFSFISYTFEGWRLFGDFDESFFPMYAEDNEFHERIRSAGHEVITAYDKLSLQRGRGEAPDADDDPDNDGPADDASSIDGGGGGAARQRRQYTNRQDRNRRFEYVHFHHVGSLSRDKANRAQSALLRVLRTSKSHAYYLYSKFAAQRDMSAKHNFYPTLNVPFGNVAISHRNCWALDPSYRRCLLDAGARPANGVCRMNAGYMQTRLVHG